MRIASWNLSCFRLAEKYNLKDFDNKEDFDYFMRVLSDNDFDVLCLQENFANENETYSKKICQKLGYNYYFDSIGSTSFCDRKYGETVSIISKHRIDKKREIRNINPGWETTLSNGAFARSYEKWFQIAKIKDLEIVNGHFIPEKTFKMDYSKDLGNDYFKKNINLLDNTHIDIFCCDFNTVSLDKMVSNFAKQKKLVNVTKNISTRPIAKDEAVINDAIFCRESIGVLDTGLIVTKNDHYLIWAETED